MKSKQESIRARNGFTLIELLVVIAIIAILAAILFPVFAKAREKARQTSCASNLKQLGLAVIQYVQDYDEAMPVGEYNSSLNSGNNYYYYGNWTVSIYPYVKSAGVFTCPDDVTTPALAGNDHIQSGAVPISYIFNVNALVTRAMVSNNNWNPAIMAKYNSPAETIWLTESGYNYNNPATFVDVNASSNAPGFLWYWTCGSGISGPYINCGHLATGNFAGRGAPYYAPNGSPYHTGGANYLLADGHVKWLLGTKVSTGEEPQGGPNCAQDGSGCIAGGPPFFSAAGTNNMTDGNGNSFAATVSKI